MSGILCCVIIRAKCTYVQNMHICVKLIRIPRPVKKNYFHIIRVGFLEDIFSEGATSGSSCFFLPCNAVFLKLFHQVPETLFKIIRQP
jgi:hypothetical protein